MTILVPVICALIGAFSGWWLVRRKRTGFFIAMMLIGAVCFGWIVVSAQGLEGYDAIARFLYAALFVLPLEIGGLIGAGIAAIKNRGSSQ